MSPCSFPEVGGENKKMQGENEFLSLGDKNMKREKNIYYISPESSNCWYVRNALQFRLKENTDIVLRRLSLTLGSISL